MKEIVTQLITAFLGSLGFALLFGLRRRYLFVSSLGGVIAWGVYLTMLAWTDVGFLSCLAAAAVAVVYAELLAHGLTTPATLFVIPAILPLVPGSSLYYAMSSAVRGDLLSTRDYGAQTLAYALAIAAGISLVTAVRQLRAKKP